jgi:hypothetical protein
MLQISKKIKVGFSIVITFYLCGNTVRSQAQTLNTGATFSGQTANYVFGIIGNIGPKPSKNLVPDLFVSDKINPKKSTNTADDIKIALFPNPVSTLLHVEISEISENEKISIRIYDFSGQKIYTNSEENKKFELDFSKLKSGIYFLEIKSNVLNKISKIFKIVKLEDENHF